MNKKKVLFFALLIANASTTQTMEEKKTEIHPLIHAILQEDLEEIDAVLKTKNPNFFHIPSQCTPLSYACILGNEKVVDTLLEAEAGPDFQAYDEAGNPLHATALTEAARYGNEEICKKLIRHGANIQPKNPDNYTPLHAAAKFGNPDIVQLLIAHQANVNAQTEKEKITPLHEVIPPSIEKAETQKKHPKKNKFESCIRLLEAGANPNAQTIYQTKRYPFPIPDQTPLMMAALRKHKHFVALLLSYKANESIQDRLGRYPLHCDGVDTLFFK